MSETVKYQQMSYKQLSIYDFLPEEKSQEVQPSESVPQVDEAQDESIYYVLDSKGNTREFSPSSDLDTRASNTLDIETYETIVEECEEAFQSTEDTDKTLGSRQCETLFSVGDLITVRKAEDVYPKGVSYEGYGVCTPEDYYHLKEFETQQGLVTFYDGKSYKCKMFKSNKLVGFYPNELK
ncbi:hypothetical protein [Bacillus sp. TH13]|uniref:hypothetical protein n=1 Tax=Bacillus sp. TH13 TaxID=2796379 RepID=UPI00191267D0|nr:hypothetical protein [Bacillus sp. TH13]MBK5492602.1 hypothetical protein [Bacillus sp. TH13]